jgi:hypothetical protein
MEITLEKLIKLVFKDKKILFFYLIISILTYPTFFYQLISTIHRFPFDHLIPEIEDTTYTTVQYWCLQSTVHQINPEKKWGVSSIVTVIQKSRTIPSVLSIWIVRRDSSSQGDTHVARHCLSEAKPLY